MRGNHVKRKVTRTESNLQTNEWTEFITELEKRLAFHEQRIRELKPIIGDLKKAKLQGIPFPGEARDSATTHN